MTVQLYTTPEYDLSKEGNLSSSEMTFIFKVFLMTYLNDSSQHSVVVFAVIIITYNSPIVCVILVLDSGKLLLWRARPNSPTYPKDCTMQFIQC